MEEGRAGSPLMFTRARRIFFADVVPRIIFFSRVLSLVHNPLDMGDLMEQISYRVLHHAPCPSL